MVLFRGIRTWLVLVFVVAAASQTVESSEVSGEPNNGFWSPAISTKSRLLNVGENKIAAIAFAGGDRYLVAGAADRLLVWETTSWQRLDDIRTGYQAWSIAAIPKTNSIVVGGELSKLELFDVQKNQRLFHLAGHSDSVLRVVCDSNGSTIASGGFDGVVRLWDVAQHRLLKAIDPKEEKDKTIFALEFSPNGKSLAFRTQNESLVMWDVAAQKERFRLTRTGVNSGSMKFSPDGAKFVTSMAGRSIAMIDAGNGKSMLTRPASWAEVYWPPSKKHFYTIEGPQISLIDSGMEVLKSGIRLTDGWLRAIAVTKDDRTMVTLDNRSDVRIHELNPDGWFANQIAPTITNRANVNGRYYNLLRIVPAPAAADSVGKFHEAGYQPERNDASFGIIPEGFHIYLEPNLYVFERSRIGLHRIPRELPAPAKLKNGNLRVWIGMPTAAFCSEAFAESAYKLPQQSKTIKEVKIYWRGYPAADEETLKRQWAPAILEVTMIDSMTTQKLLEELVSLRYSLADADILDGEVAHSLGIH